MSSYSSFSTNTAVSLVAVAPVLLVPPHPLRGLGDDEGVPPGGGEEAHASGDLLQHQGHGGGRQGEREQQDHMVWRCLAFSFPLASPSDPMSYLVPLVKTPLLWLEVRLALHVRCRLLPVRGPPPVPAPHLPGAVW